MNILSDLNERQREAVTTTEGFVRIIAGAGSGKTRALAHRYAYLVRAAGIPAGNILCVTFTNKAAGEMRRRVRALAGDGTDTSLITTYHGFCVRVLRESIGHLFWPENFRILDEAEQKKILEEIYSALGLKLDYASFEKIIALIEQKKSTTDYVSLLLSRDKGDYDAGATLDEKIINRYLLYQKKIFGLDFSDLINFVFVLFEQFPDICAEWQKRLVYIQVDEFQDSSRREMKLIDILAQANRNLFVVGDPDQNIYEWRGADVSLLVDFDRTHPGTKTILLEQNYRSTGKILAAANELISHNVNRVPKTLFTTGEAGTDVVHLHCKTEEEEGAAVVAEIRKLLCEGFRLRDIAILYRSGFLSQFLEKAFTAEGIPYEIFGSVRFFERMEIVDAIAYLKLVERDDDAALMRVVNKPRRGFGRVKARRLRELAEADGTSLLVALAKYADTELACPKAGELAQSIYGLREKKDSMPVSEILQRLLVESGYEQYIRESGNMERFDNLSELKKITVDSEREYGKTVIQDNLPGEFMPLSVYLKQLEFASEENLDDAVDRVKMMTVHAAKGLEFPVCFVVGMTDGIFPSSRTIEERAQAGLEEERRLCFVAMTRAMKRLYLADSEGDGLNGRKKLPSRFFADIGEHNFVRIGAISKEVAEQMRTLAAHVERPQPERLGVGSRVRHAVFGEGEIIGLDEHRGIYEVQFDSGTVRPISTDYDFGMWRDLLESADSTTPVQNSESKLHEAGESPTPSSVPENRQHKIVDGTARDQNPEKKTSEIKKDEEHVRKPSKSAYINTISDDQTPESVRTASERVPFAGQVDYTAAAIPPREKSNKKTESPEQLSLFDDEAAAPESGDGSDISVPVIEISLPDTPEWQSSFHLPESSGAAEPDTSRKNAPANLWNDPNVPKTGWFCVEISDLGMPAAVCGMCGKQTIRYVHHMNHPEYPRQIGAGCVCAGRMEGDIEGAKRREAELKSREARRKTFIHHSRKRSKNGNEYFKYNGEIVTIIQDKFRRGHYKAVWRGIFTQARPTPEEALSEVFDLICGKKQY